MPTVSSPPAPDNRPDAPPVHPQVQRQLSELHDRLAASGELRSLDALSGFYATFRERFGPEVLRRHDGEDLLRLMHDTSNRDGLVYWLEFKDDEEFPNIFGGIAGGSALKFGLYRRRETGAWMTGTPNAQREISTVEAANLARKHRDELLAACDVLKAVGPDGSDSAYRALQADLSHAAPTVSDLAWGRKYLSLLFPEKLDDFHAPSYQRFNLVKILQVPPEGEGRYICSGRFVALARHFNWPMNHLTEVLNRRHGAPHRYWRIGTRGGDDGTFHWPMMKERGVVAVGWSGLGDMSEALKGEQPFKELVRDALNKVQQAAPAVIGRSAQQLAHFCQTIQEGDYILASDGARVLAIGRVTGGYQFDATQAFAHMRPVEWLDIREWKLPTTEGLLTTVHECRKHPENLVAVETRLLEREVPEVGGGTSTGKEPEAGNRWTKGGTIGRVQDVLDRKGQLILYGPPGTGKTYWAERAARELAALHNYGRGYHDLGAEDRVRVNGDGVTGFVRFCSFHAAYGYEDFIEGYRPVSRNGVLHFELRDGLFKTLCDDAAAAPGKSFYLIIDEINRGDIPRIFGELLTLLEKSKRGMRLSLPLSGRPFGVPPNVCVIGTMNTADRSIALLDAALRRRFGFIELMPDPATLGDAVVAGIALGPWLDSLNRLITANTGRDGRNLQVGHSYFLAEGRPIRDLNTLAHILQEDVLPLLEEYCYDDWEALERILGSRLVDVGDRRFRTEVFGTGRQEELVSAILAAVPDVSASAIAVAADASAAAEPEEADAEGDGA